ncbi:MAG TPA: NAD(P)-binding domain-containing protein [Candidatus Limnocylindria bacterium]|nr:NAD(P)-binding domain-containing protein [Candidatus Limnocylindria bacterium]
MIQEQTEERKMAGTITGQRVGVVGVGNMGSAVARSMVRGGFDVLVYDIREEAVRPLVELGAKAAPSLEALVAAVKWVSVVVVSDDQVRSVGGTVVDLATPGTIVAVHSTVRPTTVAALAERGARRDVVVVDVAVNGGNEKANLGKLTLMVGGEAEPIRYAMPLLQTFGSHIFHVGPIGSGLVGKLVNNLIAIGSYALQLEAVELAAAYGMDEDTVATVVSFSQGDNRGMRTWGRHDRKRAERAAQGVSWYERMGRDLEEAAIAAGLREVTLPLTAVIAEALPNKLRRRDRVLAQRGPLPKIPRCRECDSELAPPFREAGVHPECRTA